MELVKEKIRTNRSVGKAVSQLTLEDDFNVPDIKPDVEQVIEETGEIRITEAKPSEGKIIIRGKLDFSILYVGANIKQPLYKMSGSLPFEESINMDGLRPEHTVKVRWDMEDLRTRVINSRKISVRSIISLSIVAQHMITEEVASAENEDMSMYVLGRKFDLSQIHMQKKDILRIKKEITIPSSKPNAMEIIWDRVTPGSMDIKVLDGKVSVRGDMNVFVMYASAEEDNPFQYFGNDINFSESVETPDTTEEMIGHIEAKMIHWELSVKENEDGELRKIEVEVVMELSMTIYVEKQMHILEDVYAIDRCLEPVSNRLSFDNIMMQNQSAIKLSKIIPVERDRAKILQICQTNANIKVDRMTMSNQGILVEGVVYIQVLYIAADDKIPVNAVKGMIPFSHVIEVPGIHNRCTFEIIPVLGAVSSAMADSEEIEVRTELVLNSIVFEQLDIPVITDIVEKPVDVEHMEKLPGIVGYIVQNGDSMWSIAKRYATTREQLMRINGLENDVLKRGQKLLIIREPAFSC